MRKNVKEIMLNKSFAGGYGSVSEDEHPHEIMNLFQTDEGELYIYVPPYGGYDTKNHDVGYILLTSEWHHKATEVLYLVSGLTLMHHGGLEAKPEEREVQKKEIIERNIRYGGKLLSEINTEEKTFYMTFKADKVVRPKKRMFLVWDKNSNDFVKNADTITITLPDAYKYQRQRGFITESQNYYSQMKEIIEDKNSEYWEEKNYPEKVPKDVAVHPSPFHFLKLIHKESDETIYTNLFFEFFSKNPVLFNLFAREVLKVSEDDSYTVKKEVQAAKGKGRIDLLAEGNNRVIAIENKIKSSLHGIDKREEISQLTKYVQFIEKEFDGKKETHYFLFEPNYNEIDIAYFDKGAGGVKFQPVCYSEIYRFFKKHIDAFKSGEHGQYAEDFVNSLRIHTETMRETVERKFLSVIQKD
jgi:hypothetical protein